MAAELARLSVVVPVGPGDAVAPVLREQLRALPAAAELRAVCANADDAARMRAAATRDGLDRGPLWQCETAPRGRAAQQNAGAVAATRPWLVVPACRFAAGAGHAAGAGRFPARRRARARLLRPALSRRWSGADAAQCARCVGAQPLARPAVRRPGPGAAAHGVPRARRLRHRAWLPARTTTWSGARAAPACRCGRCTRRCTPARANTPSTAGPGPPHEPCARAGRRRGVVHADGVRP